MSEVSSINTSSPVAYILVGVPGVGKTTWAQTQTLVNPYVYLSTDAYIEQYSQQEGKEYAIVFKQKMPQAIENMINDTITARNNKQNIIWDQTSTTKESRARKIDMLPGYRKIAVVFHTPDREELNRRLDSRPNKKIPKYVVDNMIEFWEEPALDEGFDDIINL